MRKLLVLPTWIIVLLSVSFLPARHPLKARTPTLQEWEKGSTALNDQFSLLFWIICICHTFLASFLWWRIHG